MTEKSNKKLSNRYLDQRSAIQMVEVPLLWFAAVLGCVRPCVVSTPQLIKGHYVHAAGAEHSQQEVMRHHELIVRRGAPLKSHAFRVHVKDLPGKRYK